MLDAYWERMGLRVPIYIAAGMAQQAALYHKLFAQWACRHADAPASGPVHPPAVLKHVAPFSRAHLDAPGPCVLFATPGMLHAGVALQAFRCWAGDSRNMVLFPTHCIRGTLGHRLLMGAKEVSVSAPSGSVQSKVTLNVACNVRQLSFSAHADAKGILSLLRTVHPTAVVLVHGERHKMAYLKSRVTALLGMPCYDPQNGESLRLSIAPAFDAQVATSRAESVKWVAFGKRGRGDQAGDGDDDDGIGCKKETRPRRSHWPGSLRSRAVHCDRNELLLVGAGVSDDQPSKRDTRGVLVLRERAALLPPDGNALQSLANHAHLVQQQVLVPLSHTCSWHAH